MIAPAGMIGLTSISGDVGAGIRIGQWLNGNGFSRYEHAFLSLGDGTILEAEPGGSRIAPLSEYPADSVYWCWNIWKQVPFAFRNWKLVQVAAWNRYVGIPYSFADYASLAARRLRIPVPGLRRYVASSGHEICSQLVDLFYREEFGVGIIPGEWAGYVTPGSIWERDRKLGRTTDVRLPGP
jgi:hypothetical protein